VLVGLLLTAGLAFGAMVSTPSEFKSRALILLLPSEAAVGEGGNPFLALSGLEQPAALVTAYFTSAGAQEEVAARSATASYVVAIDAATRGPVILVEVTDVTAAQSLSTLDYLTERIPEELQRLQVEVEAPDDSVIGSMLLTRDADAVEDSSATVRIVIAALVVGLAGTIFLAFAIDSFLARRTKRRPTTKRSQPASARDGGPPPPADDADASVGSGHAEATPAAPERAPSAIAERPKSSQRSWSP
jgi:hypothetical protein